MKVAIKRMSEKVPIFTTVSTLEDFMGIFMQENNVCKLIVGRMDGGLIIEMLSVEEVDGLKKNIKKSGMH